MSDGISIVVPTLNRGDYLASCLGDLLAQRGVDFEVIVVDQSGAGSPEAIARHREDPRLVYHQVDFRGLPEARNFGWRRARFDRVLFVDDDVRCGSDLARRHADALREPGVGLVAGGIDEPYARPPVGPPVGRFRRWTATTRGGFSAHGDYEVAHAKGCNFSVRRDVLAEVGGFDEALNVGAALYEELELCLRVRSSGHRVVFRGAARLTHLTAPSGGCRVAEVERHVFGLAHNRAAVVRRHLAWFEAPVALSRLMVTGAAFAVRYRDARAIRACVLGLRAGLRTGRAEPLQGR